MLYVKGINIVDKRHEQVNVCKGSCTHVQRGKVEVCSRCSKRSCQRIEKMTSTLYEPDEAKISKGCGHFFKELKEAGIGDIPAAKITHLRLQSESQRHETRHGPHGQTDEVGTLDHLPKALCHPCTNLSD